MGSVFRVNFNLTLVEMMVAPDDTFVRSNLSDWPINYAT